MFPVYTENFMNKITLCLNIKKMNNFYFHGISFQTIYTLLNPSFKINWNSSDNGEVFTSWISKLLL